MGECDYPESILYIGISQNIIMLMLFCDFYYNAYIKSNEKLEKSIWMANTPVLDKNKL